MSKIKRTRRAVWHTKSDGSEDIEGLNGMTIEEMLGKGQYGVVYKVKGKTHLGKGLSTPLALKVLNRNKMRKSRDPVGQSSDGMVAYMNGLDKTAREIRIMTYLQNVPNILTGEWSDSDDDGEKHMKASDFPDVQSAIAAGVIPSSPSDRLSPVSSNLLRKTITGSKPLPKPRASSLAQSSLVSALKTPQKGDAKDDKKEKDDGSESRNPYRKYIVSLKEVIDDSEDESLSLLFTYMPGGSLMTMNLHALPDGAEVQRFFAPVDLATSRGSFLLTFAGEQQAVASLEGDDFNFSDTSVGVPDATGGSAAKARFQRCDGYDASSIYALIQQLLLAVKFMHDRGVAHRDIKPENLLLDEQSVLHIADFGCAEYHSENPEMSSAGDSVFQFERSNGMVRHTAGTPAYWAPECVKGALEDTTSTSEADELVEALARSAEFIDLDGGSESTTSGSGRAKDFDVFAVDMWAVGLCLHAMLFNRLPFAVQGGGDPLQMFEDIYRADPVPAPLLAARDIASPGKDPAGPNSSPAGAPIVHPRARMNSSPTHRRPTAHTESVAQVEHGSWAEGLLRGLLDKDPRSRLTVDEALRVVYISSPRRGR